MARLITHLWLLSTLIYLVESNCPIGILPEFCIDEAIPGCTFGSFDRYNVNSNRSSSGLRDVIFSWKYLKNNEIIKNLTWKASLDENIIGFQITLLNEYKEKHFFYNLSLLNFRKENSEILFSFACQLDRATSDFYICLIALPYGRNASPICQTALQTKSTTSEQTPVIETTLQTKSTTSEQTPVIETMNIVTSDQIPVIEPEHPFLWLVIFGVVLFVVTLVGFALVLLKKWICLRDDISDNISVQLENINDDNYITMEFISKYKQRNNFSAISEELEAINDFRC